MPRDGKLVMAARGGFAARGLLYGLMGYLAFQGQAKDPQAAIVWFSRHGGAQILSRSRSVLPATACGGCSMLPSMPTIMAMTARAG